jgi:hypothetical protein
VLVRGASGAAAVDRLTTIALDRQRPAAVRAAAVGGLIDLERSSIRPLLQALQKDPVPEIAELAAGGAARHARPDDPEAVRQTLARNPAALTLPELLATIEAAQVKEREARPGERARWMAVRAAAHLALARRRSRIALYDLRETLERAKEPLPVAFLAALAGAGDASCLEPIAAAYAASTRRSDDWWRDHLVETFRAIVARERLTRRHAVAKKIARRWPRILDELWSPASVRLREPRLR